MPNMWILMTTLNMLFMLTLITSMNFNFMIKLKALMIKKKMNW